MWGGVGPVVWGAVWGDDAVTYATHCAVVSSLCSGGCKKSRLNVTSGGGGGGLISELVTIGYLAGTGEALNTGIALTPSNRETGGAMLHCSSTATL